jgi:hypothetical protein
MVLKVILGAVILCVIETCNGIIRIHFFTKYFGKQKAKIISFSLGLLMACIAIFLLVSWINPKTFLESFSLGFIWATSMVAYDIWVGRILFKLSWDKILKDFDLRSGNLLSLGIFAIAILPPFLFWAY